MLAQKHGLEDLGQAFLGQLNATQEKYKEKLKRKVEEVSAAVRGCPCVHQCGQPALSELRLPGPDDAFLLRAVEDRLQTTILK